MPPGSVKGAAPNQPRVESTISISHTPFSLAYYLFDLRHYMTRLSFGLRDFPNTISRLFAGGLISARRPSLFAEHRTFLAWR